MRTLSFLTIFFLFLFSKRLQAQEIKLGFKGGANISVVKAYLRDSHSDYKFGYLAGFFLDINTSETFSVTTKINLSEKGYAYTNPQAIKHVYPLYYLDLPIL